jgi:hypothetical protein
MSLYEPRLKSFFDAGLLSIFLGFLLSYFILANRLKKKEIILDFKYFFLTSFTFATAVTAFLGVAYLKIMAPIFIGLVYLCGIKFEVTKLEISSIQNVSLNGKRLASIALSIFTTVLILVTSVQVHYDYFHGSVPSIDLAVNNTSPSTWLKNFDATYWPVITQTLLPSLDAIEMYYGSGYISNTLALIFVSVMMLLILNLVKTDKYGVLIILFSFFIYLWDFSHSPRPHILVGLALCLLMLSGGNFGLQILAVTILLLAKRDGLIIFLIISAIIGLLWILLDYKKSSREVLKWEEKAIFISISALILPLSYFILQWTPIKDNTIYDVIVKIVSGLDFSIMSSQSIQLATGTMIALFFAIIIQGFGQFSRTGLVVVSAIFLYILLSAQALTVLSQPNEGTVSRKFVYFFLPCLLVFCSNHWQKK